MTLANDILERLTELDRDALDDQVVPNPMSRHDLQVFIDKYEARRPAISMLDNGNYRAVWKNTEKEQLGLTFLGEWRVNYVAFYLSAGRIKREYGKASFEDIDLLVRDPQTDLLPVLYRE